MARQLMGTKAFLRSRDERKRVEMRFAHLKLIMALSARGSEVFPVPATNSILPLSCRTSRPWRYVLGAASHPTARTV